MTISPISFEHEDNLGIEPLWTSEGIISEEEPRITDKRTVLGTRSIIDQPIKFTDVGDRIEYMHPNIMPDTSSDVSVGIGGIPDQGIKMVPVIVNELPNQEHGGISGPCTASYLVTTLSGDEIGTMQPVLRRPSVGTLDTSAVASTGNPDPGPSNTVKYGTAFYDPVEETWVLFNANETLSTTLCPEP